MNQQASLVVRDNLIIRDNDVNRTVFFSTVFLLEKKHESPCWRYSMGFRG